MASIQRLTRPKPLSTTIDFGDGDTVAISFDTNRITPAWVNQTQERDALAVARALADAILEWDVVADEQGTPYPPTVENIAALAYPAETKIAMRLIEASSPGSEEGNASSKPSMSSQGQTESSTTASHLPTSPAGSESSQLPSASAAQSSS